MVAVTSPKHEAGAMWVKRGHTAGHIRRNQSATNHTESPHWAASRQVPQTLLEFLLATLLSFFFETAQAAAQSSEPYIRTHGDAVEQCVGRGTSLGQARQTSSLPGQRQNLGLGCSPHCFLVSSRLDTTRLYPVYREDTDHTQRSWQGCRHNSLVGKLGTEQLP